MFGSVLQKVVAVCKTKNYLLLPWPMSIVTIFCSTCWIVYVILKNQLYLLIPNVFGEIFGFLGLILFLSYRAKTLRQQRYDKAKNMPCPTPKTLNDGPAIITNDINSSPAAAKNDVLVSPQKSDEAAANNRV